MKTFTDHPVITRENRHFIHTAPDAAVEFYDTTGKATLPAGEDIRIWTTDPGQKDTILNAYRSDGASLRPLRRINEFTFVLYDPQAETLIAVRSLLGNVPLFYHRPENPDKAILFSFSFRSLLESQVFRPEMNLSAVKEYLRSDNELPEHNQTMIREINRLLPGQQLLITKLSAPDSRAFFLRPFYPFQNTLPAAFPGKNDEEEIRQLLKNTAVSLADLPSKTAVLQEEISLMKIPVTTIRFHNPEKLYTLSCQTYPVPENSTDPVPGMKEYQKFAEPVTGAFETLKRLTGITGQPVYQKNYFLQPETLKILKDKGIETLMSGAGAEKAGTLSLLYAEDLLRRKEWMKLSETLTYLFSKDAGKAPPWIFNGKSATIHFLLSRSYLRRGPLNVIPVLFRLVQYFNCGPEDFLAYLSVRLYRKIHGPASQNPAKASGSVKNFLRKISGFQEDAPEEYLKGLLGKDITALREEIFEITHQAGIKVSEPYFQKHFICHCMNILHRAPYAEPFPDPASWLFDRHKDSDGERKITLSACETLSELAQEFFIRTPENHKIWTLTGREDFDRNMDIVSDQGIPPELKTRQMEDLDRVIRTGIWLDYLNKLS